jgi:hypothetical protein
LRGHINIKSVAQGGLQAHTYDRFFNTVIIVIIGAGIVLRASKYLSNWSLRGDELAVLLNLVNRSIFGLLLKPLDYEQAAPPVFLLITKTLMILLGESEYVLRAISFLAGCASLFLLFRLVNRVTGRYGAVFILLCFAFAYYPIYYAAELKQYSSDIFVSLVLVSFAFEHISHETHRQDFWVLGFVGAAAMSFSHPAIFVLAGIGLTLFIHYFWDKQKRIWISTVGIVWSCIFLIMYLTLLRPQTMSAYLLTFWRDLRSFMPVPPWNDPAWFFQSTQHLFTTLSGLPVNGVYLLIPLYIYGLWMFFKEKQWQWIGITTIPIGINIIVSGFEKFPFHGRLILYLLPLVYIVYAKGLEGLLDLVRRKTLSNLLYALLIITFIIPSAISTTNTFIFTKSYLQEDMKPVFSYMEKNSHSGDLVYVYHYVDKKFEYYAPQFHLDDLRVIQGQDRSKNGNKYINDLSGLPRGQRIWFVFSFIGDTRIDRKYKEDERKYILSILMQSGTLVQEVYSTNNVSSAHLFILQ